MADADVTLKVGLNSDDALKTARQTRKELADILSKVDSKNASASFKSLEVRLKDISTKSRALGSELRDLANKKVPTETFTQLNNEIKNTEIKVDKLKEKMRRFTETGGRTSSVAYARMEYDLTASQKELKSLRRRRSYMTNIAKNAYTPGSNTEEYTQKTEQLKRYNDQLAIGIRRLQEMASKQSLVITDRSIKAEGQEATSATESLGRLENQKKRTTKSNQDLGLEAFKTKVKLEDERTSSTKLSDSFKTLSSAIHKAFVVMSAIGKGAKSLINRLRGVNTGVDDTSKSMKNLLKFALKYGLGLRSIFILYKRLRSAGVEAYKGLASQFPELQAELNSLKNSFFQLKNSIATMAQPILSYLVPAIKTLMSWLTAAMNAIANFFAILTGAKYIYKASNANKDWAKSAGGAGKAAKEANKDIAEYDNLMLIQQDNDNSGGGGGGAADDYAGAFEKVKAESDLAKEIKDAIEKGDWEGVGRALAKRLNNVQNIVDNWIQTKLRPKGKLWATRIARILNGLTEEWDSAKFGQMVSHGLMAIMDIIATWWENYHWDTLGKKIGTAITNIFLEWEPETVARFLARKFNALGSFLLGLTDSKDGIKFTLIGQKIADTIKKTFENIKWKDIATGISRFVKGLSTSLRTAIQESNLGTTVGNAINEFLAGLDLKGTLTDLAKTANAIVKAIGDAIRTVDWNEIGDAIGALITEIDWTEVFKTVIITAQKLLTVAQKIIKAIGEAITKIDWEEIGQALADLLASIDWGKLIVTLIQVATSLIKGLGQALLKIASDPKALASLATGLVTIFGAKWLWKKITGVFKTGLTSAIGNASSGLGSVLNGVLGKALAGYALFEGGSSLVGSVGSVVAYALGDDKLSAEYSKMAQAPTQYLVNAVSTAVEAASEYSETTGRSTLSNAVRDMLGFEDVTETAIEKNLQLQADLNAKYYGENGIITQYNKKRLAREKALTDSMVANSNHYADIARKNAGVVSTATQAAITSSNHYAQIAQSNAQKHTSSYAQMNQSAQHHAEIAKANAGTYENSRKQMETASNHYAQIAQRNAQTHVTSDKQMEASSTHHLQIAKANAGVYEKVKQEAINNSNHYVEIAKGNSAKITESAQTMTTNVEASVTTIPSSFDTTFTSAYAKVTNAFSGVKTFFGDVAQGVKSPFSTMADYFKTTFSDSWNGVVSVFQSNSPQFQSIQDSISGVFKNSINSMIGGLNSSFISPFRTLSSIFAKMRGFSIGGAQIFKSLPSFSVPSIPKLAQGAVIPPNREFMAVLGDQKQGTNIEAPLDTIVQALQIALENNTTNNQPITLNLNGRQIAQAVWDEENKTYKQTNMRYRYS